MHRRDRDSESIKRARRHECADVAEATSQDSRATKPHEVQLREAEERFRRAQEIANVSVFDWDLETDEVQTSVHLLALRDLPPESTFKNWLKHVHPEDVKRLQDAVQLARHSEAEQEVKVRLVKPDGREVWVQVCGQFVRGDTGQDGHIVGVAIDISAAKEAERALREAHNRLETRVAERTAELSAANKNLQAEILQRIQAQEALEAQASKLREQAQLLDLANDAIFIRKLDGTVWYWNEGAERLYGWTRKEVMHQTLLRFLKTEYPLPIQELEHILLQEGKWEGELVHTRRDGSKVTVASRWTLWRDEEGTPQGWLQINSDISERKRAEELLRRLSARLLQTQDEERRRIARELHDSAGQLLVGLDINLVTVQRESEKLSANASRALSESLGLVKELSTELRNISHLLHPPLLDEAGLPAAIRWYVERFSHRSKIAVKLNLPDNLGRLPREIETTIFRIVQESLTNVHRHSGSKHAEIRLTREFARVTVEVCDEGKGMKTESYRTYSGVLTPGVGIQGMRERIRQLGGRFEIRSGETGTTVLASLLLDNVEAKSAD